MAIGTLGSGTNQIIPFAIGAGANVLTPDEWAADIVTRQGFQSGIAKSIEYNTAARQASCVASMIAQFTADFSPAGVYNDDGNLLGQEQNFVNALRQFFAGIPDLPDVSAAANTIAINPQQPATSYVAPMEFFIRVANTNALTVSNNGATFISVSGLPVLPLLLQAGGVLLPGDVISGSKILVSLDLNASAFRLISPRGNDPGPPMVIHYGIDTSNVANVITAITDSTVVAMSAPLWFGIVPQNNNSGATVFSPNGLASVPVTRGAGTALSANDIIAGTLAWMVYDGAECQLINPQQLNASSPSGGYPPNWNNISGQIQPYWIAAKSYSTGTPPGSPATGDTYLLPTGSTGAWSGHDGQITQWTGSSWVFATYPSMSLVGVGDAGETYQNQSGVWVLLYLRSPGQNKFFSQGDG